MKTQKVIGAIIILAIFVYVAYQALPFFITMASNILYLGVFSIVIIVAIYFFVKWLSK